MKNRAKTVRSSEPGCPHTGVQGATRSRLVRSAVRPRQGGHFSGPAYLPAHASHALLLPSPLVGEGPGVRGPFARLIKTVRVTRIQLPSIFDPGASGTQTQSVPLGILQYISSIAERPI
jgi:hypothetical protein